MLRPRYGMAQFPTHARDPNRTIWPPDLVPILREHLPNHPALVGVPDRALEQLLTTVFFSSLETEELEHHQIRIAFLGRSAAPFSTPKAHASPHRAIGFRRPTRFDGRHLLKLGRATGSDRIVTMVSISAEDALEIVGLAREGHRPAGDDC